MSVLTRKDIATGALPTVVDWTRVAEELDAKGFAVMPKLLTPSGCRAVASLYPEDARFRSRIVMARHGFGRGEYKYFAYPLPEPIDSAKKLLSAASKGRQPPEYGDGHRNPISRGPRGISKALP